MIKKKYIQKKEENDWRNGLTKKKTRLEHDEL